MLSSSSSIAADCIAAFRGKPVRIFADNDAAGKKAATKWKSQLMGVASSVDQFDSGEYCDMPGADFSDAFNAVAERVLPV